MTFYTSIGLDSSDNPHISYNKGYTSKGELRYAKWTGSEWVIQTVDSEFSSGFGEFSSIIIDSTDKPHISYKGAGYQVRYAHWTGTSWDIEIIYPGPQTVDMTSLALDSAGGPHIIYFDRYNEDLVYARKISDEWITEPVDSGLANVYLSIDLDSADNPCITYSSYIHNSQVIQWDFIYATRVNGVWNFESIEANPDAQVSDNSLKLDSDNVPHICYTAYYTSLADTDLKYATLSGGNWYTESLTTDSNVKYPSIALSQDNYPSISYMLDCEKIGRTYGNNYCLSYVTWTGSTWNNEIVDVGKGNVGKYSSIVIDSNDYAHISYHDEYHGDLKYAYGTFGDWELDVVDEGFWYPASQKYYDVVGQWTSIALDSSEQPHISYKSPSPETGYHHKLRYAQRAGAEWVSETVPLVSNGLDCTHLALDQFDNARMSIWKGSGNTATYELLYAIWTGTEWSFEVVEGEGVGYFTSLELDGSYNPHISYYDPINDDLKYARWTGTEWHIEVVDSDGEVGAYTSLALDSSDNPHISYYDSTNDDLKYARWTGTEWLTEVIDAEGDVGWYTSLALDGGNNPHISYYDSTNDDLKYARWTGTEWHIEVVDSDGKVGTYTSLALDSSDNPHISYYDISNYDLKVASASVKYLGPTATIVASLEDLVIVGMIKYGVLNNLKLATWQADWLKDHDITSGEFNEPEDDPRSYSISHTRLTPSFNDHGLGYIGNLSVTNENDYPLNVTLTGLDGFIVESTQNRTIQSILGVLHEVNDGVVSYIPGAWVLLDAQGGEKDTATIAVQGFCIGPYDVSPESGPLEIRPPSMVDAPDTLSSTREIVEFTNSLGYPSSFTQIDAMLARSVIYFALTGQDVTPEKLGGTYPGHDIDAIVSFSRGSLMGVGVEPEGIPMFTYGTGAEATPAEEETPIDTVPGFSIPGFPIPAVILSIAILVWMIRRQPRSKYTCPIC